MADLGKFVHLHNHSHFSTLDGHNRIGDLVNRTKELGMGAVALTDHGNLFGAYQFQNKCKAAGIKPIIGCEAYFSPVPRTDKSSPAARTRYHFLLLCENVEGYRNLSRMISKGYLEGFYYKPRIDMELLEQHHEGIIATSACIQGPICQAILNDQLGEAQRQLDNFVQIFGRDRFFIEIMDHNYPDQKKVNAGLLEIAKKNNLSLVATNDCHYLTEHDYGAHDTMLCIQMGKTLDDPGRMKFETNEFYLKTPEQMIQLFGHLDGAINNTLEIADRCDCLIPDKQTLLPRYKTPHGEPAAQFLHGLVDKGLKWRYGSDLKDVHHERARHELGIIESMGFVDYFLVVWDFISWSREHGIPVGPGRGSGAGSIVAYALGITNLDPLENGLLFERFLNPERVSMPDFDIDFCFERRGRVIEYVRNKYGADCVAQIITFGTMKAKNSIRDVGRVMNMPLSRVDEVAKLVPGGPNVTLERALGDSQELKELYDTDPQVKELIDRARGVEGAIRQPGTHAAGVVICDQPLIDLIPLYKPPGDDAMPATQFNMTEVEEIGLLKMDFLGLKNLTIIDRCIKSINATYDTNLAADDIPLDDPKTYELLQQGKGLGIFQFESSGMRELLKSFKPTQFSDLSVITSLYRPGPMENIPEFIARKEGRTPITYDHPDLKPILQETYGLFVYQEQVMQVAQQLAGYTLGGADILRRAMGKKKAEAMAKERVKFLEGCAERGIDEPTATRVFDTMEKFASYGFNKSHAAAYSVVSVQTAWLKANYPVHFYAALLTNEIGGDDAKISMYMEEAEGEGTQILPPDINASGVHFTPDGENIRFGLAAIKGVGEAAVESIQAERDQNGPFKSFQDFVARVDKRHINSRAIEAMIKCGAFDAFGHNRPSLLDVMPRVMEVAGTARADDGPQTSLFDMMSEDQTGGLTDEITIPRLRDWDEKQRLEIERELAGFYLSGHPLDRYDPDFDAFSTASALEIARLPKGEQVEWVGFIKRIVPRNDRNGRPFAFVECEDKSGPMELTFFADAFAKCREVLREGDALWVSGRVDSWKDTKKILVNDAKGLDEVRAQRIKAIEISLSWRQISEPNMTQVLELMKRHKGRRRLWLCVSEQDNEVRLEAGNGHGIQPDSTLVRELQDLEWIKSLRFIANRTGR